MYQDATSIPCVSSDHEIRVNVVNWFRDALDSLRTLTFPIPSQIFSMMMPYMGVVPLNKTIITQWPGISLLAVYIRYTVFWGWMLWMFILTHPMKPPWHHTCATLRSSESSSGKVPDAWPNHGPWGCIERPRSSRLSPEFLGKKKCIFLGFLLMFGNIFWKMFFLLIFLGDPNSRMIWVKYHEISWGMWKKCSERVVSGSFCYMA